MKEMLNGSAKFQSLDIPTDKQLNLVFMTKLKTLKKFLLRKVVMPICNNEKLLQLDVALAYCMDKLK